MAAIAHLDKLVAGCLLAALALLSINVAAAEQTPLPSSEPKEAALTPTADGTTQNTAPTGNSADESPMLLYLVPWNANPATNKNGAKFTLYQPWGSHFDPLTPAQTAQLNTP